jgi:hypothetical protein
MLFGFNWDFKKGQSVEYCKDDGMYGLELAQDEVFRSSLKPAKGYSDVRLLIVSASNSVV